MDKIDDIQKGLDGLKQDMPPEGMAGQIGKLFANLFQHTVPVVHLPAGEYDFARKLTVDPQTREAVFVGETPVADVHLAQLGAIPGGPRPLPPPPPNPPKPPRPTTRLTTEQTAKHTNKSIIVKTGADGSDSEDRYEIVWDADRDTRGDPD